MADVTAAVYARLLAVTAVTAIVAGRIYPLIVPQGTSRAAITYQKISATRVSAMGSDAALTSARVSISSWSKPKGTYPEAKALATAVRVALQRFRGTIGGVVVQAVYVGSDLDDYDDATRSWRIVTDYTIWYNE